MWTAATMYFSKRMSEKNNFRGYIVLNLLQTKTIITATISVSESIHSLLPESEEEKKSLWRNSKNNEKYSTILRMNLREGTINNMALKSNELPLDENEDKWYKLKYYPFICYSSPIKDWLINPMTTKEANLAYRCMSKKNMKRNIRKMQV